MKNHKIFKILIVDDTPSNLDILVAFLSKANLQVFVAETAFSAIERLQYIQPDLILLDVGMPGIDGFELCRLLKSHPQTMETPVIFLSAFSRTEEKIQGFEAGGVDYITKPFSELEVIARVRAQLDQAQMQKHLRQENHKLWHHLNCASQSKSKNHNPTLYKDQRDGHRLQLRLLNSFQLSVNGENRNDFRSDMVRALLAYLVLEGHQPLARQHLAEFFWPGYAASTQLNSLRVALHNLRQILTPLENLLETDRKHVRFLYDPATIWCDALSL